MFVAILLGSKTKTLLVGEGLDRQALQTICATTAEVPGIERCGYPFTTFFGPQQALLAMSLQFKKGVSSRQVESSVDEIEARLRERYPEIQHIFLEVDSVREVVAEQEMKSFDLPQKDVAYKFLERTADEQA